MPLLRLLDLWIYPSSSSAIDVAFSGLPLLRTVTREEMAASHVTLPWAQLTSLTLQRVYMHECVPVLQQTLNILHCQLELYLHSEPFDDMAITLPCVTELTLKPIPERFLGMTPIETLAAFISTLGYELQEVRITINHMYVKYTRRYFSKRLHYISRSGSKDVRGFHHPLTAKAIRPHELPATQETYDKILAGEIVVTGRQLPAFLYPANHPYNPDDIEDKLLQGPLPVASAKQIYQGPLAALRGPGYHRGNAMGRRSWGRATSVIVVSSLSSLANWSLQDGTFNYEEFFWSIVDLFKDGEGQDILDHFNYQVFGTVPQAARPAENAGPAEPSAFDILAAQRAAKRARLVAAAESGSTEL
ncbi:hypothetical protein C8R44DRAFT_865802 [Mycena epipterygia]|nr:hypothetical protein C8R44DRAFT_865802 [Mycena epipterygia]